MAILKGKIMGENSLINLFSFGDLRDTFSELLSKISGSEEGQPLVGDLPEFSLPAGIRMLLS